jgi:hypothetical protein
MKKFLKLLILPFLLVSQQLFADNDPSFNNMMLQIIKQSIPYLEAPRNCLANVQEQTGFDSCLAQMDASMKQKMLSDFASKNPSYADVAASQQLPYSADNNQHLIQYLDNQIMEMKTGINDIEQNKDAMQVMNRLTNKQQSSSNSAIPNSNSAIPNSNSGAMPNTATEGSDQLKGDW